MSASERFVAELVTRIEAQGCSLWLDGGGWGGVDALLTQQTRPHDDVDIVVEAQELDPICAVLTSWGGFTPVPRADTRAWNFVLADMRDRQVDVHVVRFDKDGNGGVYGPPQDGLVYPAQAFVGRGRVGRVPVKCMSVAFQLANRAGYRLRDKDHHDLARLRDRFGPQ